MTSKNHAHHKTSKTSVPATMSVSKLNEAKATNHRKSLVDNGLLLANW